MSSVLDWRTAPTFDGLVDYINQQIALGKIGGGVSAGLADAINRLDWRAHPTGDGLCDYVNQQVALGKITSIPSSVTWPGSGLPGDWRSTGLKTGDPLCDYLNEQIALGRIASTAPSLPGSPLLWLDGDDMDGLGTHNASLTNGTGLAIWKNKGSGAATYDFAQATGVRQPIINKVAQNGKGGCAFDGSLSEINALTNIPSVACTILVSLYSLGANAATAGLFIFQNPTIYLNLGGGANNWTTFPGGVTVINSGVTLTNTPVILSIDFIAANNINMVTNGVSVNKTTGTTLVASRPGSAIGGDPSFVQNGQFGINELVLYDPSVSTVTRKAAEAYLSAKWNITVTP